MDEQARINKLRIPGYIGVSIFFVALIIALFTRPIPFLNRYVDCIDQITF